MGLSISSRSIVLGKHPFFILGIDLWEYKFGSLLFSVSMETAAKLKMHM